MNQIAAKITIQLIKIHKIIQQRNRQMSSFGTITDRLKMNNQLVRILIDLSSKKSSIIQHDLVKPNEHFKSSTAKPSTNANLNPEKSTNYSKATEYTSLRIVGQGHQVPSIQQLILTTGQQVAIKIIKMNKQPKRETHS